MDTIKEFKKIVSEVDEKSIELNYYSDIYGKVKNFLFDKLEVSKEKKKNAKDIIENLDLILKYTGFYNSNWLTYEELISNSKFHDKFIENIEYFKYPEHIVDLINKYYHSYLEVKNRDRKGFFTTKLLEYLAKVKIDNFGYSTLLLKMDDHEQYEYVQLLLQNKAPIDTISINLSYDASVFMHIHILEFAENSHDIYSLKKTTRRNTIAYKEITEYIDNNPDKAYDSLLYEISKITTNVELLNIIKLLIEEVVENEKASLSEIETCQGRFSKVLLIKDKAIKIGKSRATDTFADNPYIVRPLIRKSINVGSEHLFIEVTERVDYYDANREELYKLYKELRDLGLVWTDIASRNIGRLNKDNIIYWKDKLELDSKDLGLEEYRGDITLKKGDLVVLDADFIFDENDPNISYTNIDVIREYEERYQKENKESNDKIIKDIKRRYKII